MAQPLDVRDNYFSIFICLLIMKWLNRRIMYTSCLTWICLKSTKRTDTNLCDRNEFVAHRSVINLRRHHIKGRSICWPLSTLNRNQLCLGPVCWFTNNNELHRRTMKYLRERRGLLSIGLKCPLLFLNQLRIKFKPSTTDRHSSNK